MAECKHKDKTCWSCGKKGHLSKMRVSLGKQQSGTQRSENLRWPRQIRQVEDDSGGDTEDSLEGIQVVKQTGGKLPPLKISLRVDECEIPMEINIGHLCL